MTRGVKCGCVPGAPHVEPMAVAAFRARKLTLGFIWDVCKRTGRVGIFVDEPRRMMFWS